MELGYWESKGIAEYVRWAALALGVQVTEKNLNETDEWHQLRKTLPTNFPNLPYLVDGEFALTESSAIPIYLAHKAGKPEFLGKDHKDQAIVRQIESVVAELRDKLWDVIFDFKAPEAAFKGLVTGDGAVATKLGYLNKFLGEKHFFLGYLTVADLIFAYNAELLDAIAASFNIKSIVAHYPHLAGLVARIHAHPALSARVAATRDLTYAPADMMNFKLFTHRETQAFNGTTSN